MVSHRREEDEEEMILEGERETAGQKQPDFRFLIITTGASAAEDGANATDGADGASEAPIQVTTENVDEYILPSLSMDALNDLFDAFDAQIAYPNEGHIKYEVGSDGLCVIIVDSDSLKAKVAAFVQEQGAKSNDNLKESLQDDQEEEDEDMPAKRRK